VGGGSQADSTWRSKSDLEVYDVCKTDSGQVRDPMNALTTKSCDTGTTILEHFQVHLTNVQCA